MGLSAMDTGSGAVADSPTAIVAGILAGAWNAAAATWQSGHFRPGSALGPAGDSEPEWQMEASRNPRPPETAPRIDSA
jgi:hypothetical protein